MERNNKVVAFGEIMLRLTPPDYTTISQAKNFIANYGGGDAFASGVIHWLIKDFNDPQFALKFGLATSILKHTLYGDVSTLSEREVLEFIETNGNAAVQR